MKTTFKAKVVIESDSLTNVGECIARDEVSLRGIKEKINSGHCVIEFINAELAVDNEPTIIIKI